MWFYLQNQGKMKYNVNSQQDEYLFKYEKCDIEFESGVNLSDASSTCTCYFGWCSYKFWLSGWWPFCCPREGEISGWCDKKVEYVLFVVGSFYGISSVWCYFQNQGKNKEACEVRTWQIFG